jgi:hypothetical protein
MLKSGIQVNKKCLDPQHYAAHRVFDGFFGLKHFISRNVLSDWQIRNLGLIHAKDGIYFFKGRSHEIETS